MATKAWLARNKRKADTVKKYAALRAELKAKGIPLLDEVPRIGHAGCRIAFLDPSATENCLIELAELPAGGGH